MRRRLALLAASAAALAGAVFATAPAQAAPTIDTIAGRGTGTRGLGGGFGGDGGPARAAWLRGPQDVAATADGGFLIADTGNDRVRFVDRRGRITTVAGRGNRGGNDVGDGGPATRARLYEPSNVVALPDGGFLVSDTVAGTVRRVDRRGRIERFAGGGGTYEEIGDGGPATAAFLSEPRGLALMPDGSVLIAEQDGNRIRRVDRDGIITTLVIDATACAPGRACPGPARFFDVAARAGGGVLFVSEFQSTVREWLPGGRIRLVGGIGPPPEVSEDYPGFGSDGPATERMLHLPRGIEALADGGFLIADTMNNRIRRVDRRGNATTLAGARYTNLLGSPESRAGGDGGPPRRAWLGAPWATSVTARRDVLIADTENHRIRIVRGVRGIRALRLRAR